MSAVQSITQHLVSIHQGRSIYQSFLSSPKLSIGRQDLAVQKSVQEEGQIPAVAGRRYSYSTT